MTHNFESNTSESKNADGNKPFKTGRVSSNGLNISFTLFGKGLPLVLAHGWGADSHSNWVTTGWTHHLAQHRRLICIDIRGHGHSDKPHTAQAYGYGDMSHDVLAVMDELHIEQADFMGYSMGAFIGAYLLGHHSNRFTSMVLGGIGDETPSSAAQGSVIAQALTAQKIEDVTDAAGRSVRQFVERNPNNDLTALAFSAARMWLEGYPLLLAGAHISDALFPVLIVNGAQDHPYVDSADSFAGALPNAQHVIIPDADHLSAVTASAFKDAVVHFLTSNHR